MQTTHHHIEYTDEWNIETTRYGDDYPGWTWVRVTQRITGITIFMGSVRDDQVPATVVLATKRHEDMERDHVTPDTDNTEDTVKPDDPHRELYLAVHRYLAACLTGTGRERHDAYSDLVEAHDRLAPSLGNGMTDE